MSATTTPKAMELGFLSFLAEPWFITPWCAFGFVTAVWMTHDAYVNNTLLGAVRKHFEQALKKIKATRAAIQAGEPGEARRDIQQAASALQSTEETAGGGHLPETHPLDRQRWARYEGATLINAHGIRIGEVRRIQPFGR